MSALETRTFRAENLEEALAAVRDQLGPDAIVVRQREGIVGGIGGFFGKRCVEVDVELPPPATHVKPVAMPARAVTNAYTNGPAFLDAEPEDDPGDLFRSLLDESSVFASTLADALDREAQAQEEPEPPSFEPPFEPMLFRPEPEPSPLDTSGAWPQTVTPTDTPELAPEPSVELVPVAEAELSPLLALTHAGIEPRLAESIVAEADQQIRVFDPDAPFLDQVREVLASRIQTRRFTGRTKRRVIALVGAAGSGKTTAAAKLCHAHVAMGRRVAAVSLHGTREAMELGRRTEGIDVELVTADHVGLIDFALAKVKRADVVIVDTPGVASRDEDGWSRLAMLLRPLEPSETHLLLPGWLYPAGVDDFIGVGVEKLGVDRVLLTHLGEGPGAGPAISGAIRSNIPVSATATADRLVPADATRLARMILP